MNAARAVIALFYPVMLTRRGAGFRGPGGQRAVFRRKGGTFEAGSGDGRQNDAELEFSGIFHAASAANGRFKTGGIPDVNAEGIDVCNTMLEAMSRGRKLGPANRELRLVDAIRA